MGRLKRRLERLEGKATAAVPDLSVEALQALSDEELDALEDAMEAAVASGDGSFQDLYAVVGERERRASSALFVALAAAHTGEELPVVRPGERCALGLLERI
jgi:hypothetical protein